MVVKIMLLFERVMGLALGAIIAVVVVLSTIHLAWIVIEDIMAPPVYLFDVREVFGILGILITVIIAIELLDTVRIYFDKRAVKVETVFLIAMMALAREVIILDLHEISGTSLLGIAAIIIALCAGFFLLKRSRGIKLGPEELGERTPEAAEKTVEKKD